MVASVLGRAPNAGDTKLAAAALSIVVRAINSPPCVGTTRLYPPTVGLCVAQGVLDFLLRMLPS